MGGINESVLPADKKPTNKEVVLSPDSFEPMPSLDLNIEMANANSIKTKEEKDLEVLNSLANILAQKQSFQKPQKTKPVSESKVPIQLQAIRQHMNNGQIHFHVDGDKPLKVAIPVADWFVVLRQIKTMNQTSFLDTENKCVAKFHPYILNNVFEVAIELIPCELGARFSEINKVAGR